MTIGYQMDHVAITVSDLDRSVEWYRAMFGFREEVRFDRPDLRKKGAMLRLGHQGLELFQPYDARALPDYAQDFHENLGVIGVKHFALVVPNLEEAQGDLRAKGGELSDIVNGKTVRYFTVKDPDGIHVEVKQPYR